MAFRHTGMGAKVVVDPKGANRELAALMKTHENNMGAVALALDVNRDTLADWFDKLEAAGHPVPGRGEARKGRKPGPPKEKKTAKKAA